jgi:3-isopropylmalate dehydrogenase
MMLRYSLDEEAAADAIDAAIKKAMANGYRTGDLAAYDCKEKVNCSQMGDIIASYI